jgi:GGDEF domain-containing protein
VNLRFYSRTLPGALAAIGSLATLALALSGHELAASGACAAAFVGALASALLAMQGRRAEVSARVLEKTGQQTERRRRLVMYDPQTGLLARWYFELRFQEECLRARRYQEPLTLLVVGFPGPPSNELLLTLAGWLLRHARASDLLGHASDDRFMLAMTNTPREGAQHFQERLHAAFDSVRVSTVNFPEDGESLADLVAATAASGRTPVPPIRQNAA